jgi:hypothetical protein
MQNQGKEKIFIDDGDVCVVEFLTITKLSTARKLGSLFV